ncbi:MAG: rhodanese-like domain-containing protein [Flavobacteriales bacterium]|nr:rhodanese-like domain-containing protein [Flavobacteriales bacterium]
MKFRSFFAAIALIAGFASCNQNIYNGVTIKQVPKEEYLALIDSFKNEYIIDVRTRLEYNREHIPNALSISFLNSEFDWKIADLDTSRPVFIYCETAHRSPFAAKSLKKAGFKNIIDLKGGYSTLRNN